MTFSIGHVEGGTGAGRKRPLREKPRHWFCACREAVGMDRIHAAGGIIGDVFTERIVRRPGYLVACPDCGARRDG